jgi:hypothetical protein
VPKCDPNKQLASFVPLPTAWVRDRAASAVCADTTAPTNLPHPTALHGQIPGLQERLQRGRNQKEQNHQAEEVHRAAPDCRKLQFSEKNSAGLLIQVKTATNQSMNNASH